MVQTVTWWCPILCNSIRDCVSPLGLSVHRSLQERIIKWAAIPFSGPPQFPKIRTRVFCSSCIGGRFFNTEPSGSPVEPGGKFNTYRTPHPTHSLTKIIAASSLLSFSPKTLFNLLENPPNFFLRAYYMSHPLGRGVASLISIIWTIIWVYWEKSIPVLV